MAVFVIRGVRMGDVAVLETLIEASVRRLQVGDYTAAQIDGALVHALGLDKQLIEDGTYFVAETVEGNIAGCGGWSFRQKLCGSDSLAGENIACGGAVAIDTAVPAAKIRAIFVHPDFARQGLGSQILAHCEEAAKAAGFQRLEMGSTLTGVPLYSLRGYREIERMAIALPNGESLAVVRMVKEV